MRPILLVLLVATSALAAPYVSITQIPRNEAAPPKRGPGSRWVVEGLFETYDGGLTNVYEINVLEIAKDLVSLPDSKSKALGYAQSIALLGELAPASAGDACSAAALINEQASGRITPKTLRNFIAHIIGSIGRIVKLAVNPNALRSDSGSRGNCIGGGRTYRIDEAWDVILSNASPYNIGLINEEACATKRLFSANDVRSNNVGAAVTASAVPAFLELIERNLPKVDKFLRVVASGGDPTREAAALAAALSS